MKRNLVIQICIATIALTSCNGISKPSPETRNYESCYNSSNTVTSTVEDDPYLENSLSTGTAPYSCRNLYGNDSKISVRTSSSAECDIVVILKSHGDMVCNAYIEAGDSYTFNLPNGYYQVFFYGGKGWNPNKTMPNGIEGGFVANESYSKDNPVSLEYQGLEYELIPQLNGNFTTKQSSAIEIF
ncbi:hypothetical protein [Hallella bergensis]|uniref:hypothetical protein n=1 Tax=Hallella bergensis TaxID=242750 RepID=UPI0023F05F39|nr:hypothetical protein [Hallella bergensis]